MGSQFKFSLNFLQHVTKDGQAHVNKWVRMNSEIDTDINHTADQRYTYETQGMLRVQFSQQVTAEPRIFL